MSGNRENWRAHYARWRFRRRVKSALALHKRGEVRPDGLVLDRLEHRLQIQWNARDVHPWDRHLPADERAHLFAEQCLEDADAAIDRLFAEFPEIDLIEFQVIDPASTCSILSGSVRRGPVELADHASAGMKLKQRGVRFRLIGWRFEPLS